MTAKKRRAVRCDGFADAGLLRGLVEFAGILALMTALTFFFLGAGRNHEPQTKNQEPKKHEQEN